MPPDETQFLGRLQIKGINIMSHGFFDVLFTTQHLVSPFTCPCECEDQYTYSHHSLSIGQKIMAIFLSMVVGAATAGLGIIPAFYIFTAAFKARNVIWEVYQKECPERNEVHILNLNWWGISYNHNHRRYREEYHQNYVPPIQTFYNQPSTPRVVNVQTPERRFDRGTPARGAQFDGYSTPIPRVGNSTPRDGGYSTPIRDFSQINHAREIPSDRTTQGGNVQVGRR